MAGLAARQGAEYGEELRKTRGRVLRFVYNGTLLLEQAQRVLAAGNLPPYETDGHRFQMELPYLNVTVPGPDRETARAALEAAFSEFVTSLGADTDGGEPYISAQASVPASETVELLPRPRR